MEFSFIFDRYSDEVDKSLNITRVKKEKEYYWTWVWKIIKSTRIIDAMHYHKESKD